MENKTATLVEWFMPAAFVTCVGWAVWHMPAYILDFYPHQVESNYEQVSAIHLRKDVTPDMAGLFGGFADPIDWGAMVLIPLFLYLGIRTVRVAPMEFQGWRPRDRGAIFIGRVTMILILAMTLVMLYEVFLRYALEQPTLWANELTLWIAGFVFLCSGLYAMQQRCHIRIFLLYDAMPRMVQRAFDTIWVALVAVFAIFLIFGSYKQVFVIKFYKWEMFGTAFDPPIPATVQPAILIIIALIAIQAIVNLVGDWNREPVAHAPAEEIDKDELAAIKRSLEDG